jgi:predicted ribosome quality control (RQC) complex YloA/Tae2 family protein
MKYSHLEQIIIGMQSFTQITKVYRQSDTQITIEFDRENTWTFDMRRDNAQIFISPKIERTKVYGAPFDILLAKKLNRSTIQSCTMHNDDKILRLVVTQSGSYKSETTMLQLEFTGKYTNAILLDKEEVVLEALRHIDEETSSRSVRVGESLVNPPAPSFTPIFYPIACVRDFLRATYDEYAAQGLARLKKEKMALISKKLEQYQRHLNALSNEEELFTQAAYAQHVGHILLANLHRIKGYETLLNFNDFEGTPMAIVPPSGCRDGSTMAESFFKKGKKTKQKALGQFRERENLEEKVQHLKLFLHTIQEASSPDEISLLFPPKGARTKVKAKTVDGVEEFWVDGVKISLGKSERGNIELLKNARARDIWFHLKDRPSAHVIVTTDKQELPKHILEAAAKLCVDFSVFEKGHYLVDYTPRREVRLQEGANVLYSKYNTLTIDKQ